MNSLFYPRLKCLLYMFLHRFQPQDMEVQLSDELAGSLRQLKVLQKHFDLREQGHSLSVMGFG